MRRSAAVGLFALLASQSSASFADTTPWYVGLAVNHSDYGSLPEAASDSPGTSHDANGWSVLGGYQVNTRFGLEASYFDLGSVSANSSGITGPVYSVSYASRPKLTGESLDVVLKWVLPQGFFVFGKVGATQSRLDQPVVGTTFSVFPGQKPTTSVNSSDSSISSTDPDYGVGLGYETGSGRTLRLGWTQYLQVGDISEFAYGSDNHLRGQGNVNSLHLDLLYRF